MIETAQQGVRNYLLELNHYREHRQKGAIRLTGRFLDVVTAGLDETDASGIRRTLELEKLAVDRYLVKPWGTPALAEVRVTIVDRAKDGSAPDQRENGKLLLSGDRMMVIDGWDAANGRWFNDSPAQPLTDDMVWNMIHSAVQNYLRVESWVPGSPNESTYFGEGMEDPFMKARSAYLKRLDRSNISRLFSETRTTVEKLEVLAGRPEGLATVVLSGAVTTVDLDGRSVSQPFERRIVVALLSGWMVVDEEISAGTWMSGGDLTAVLNAHDRTHF